VVWCVYSVCYVYGVCVVRSAMCVGVGWSDGGEVCTLHEVWMGREW